MDLSSLPFAGHPAQILCLVLFAFFLAGQAIAYFGLFGLFIFRFRPLPRLKTTGGQPGVSVLKPCIANHDNESENFRNFFQQSYSGPFELIFAVSSESDPIVPIIRGLMAEFPDVDAKLVVSTTRIAYWNKVNALRDAQAQAKHAVIIWSDSDAVVKPDYLSQMVACLQEPGVSVVTTPQYDFRANNFATHFKVLGNNCDDATFMMAYNLLVRKKRVALGHSIGFWASEFKEFEEEGWDTISRFFADDLALPYLFAKHGKRVVFRNVYCPVEYSNKTLSQVISQKRRWVMCQRQAVGNRLVYLTAPLFYPEVPSLALVLITGFSPFAWALFAWACITRIGISAIFEWLMLGSLRMSLKYFWTVPLWDLAQVAFVIDGFFRQTIMLGGRRFALDRGFFLRPLP